MPQLLRTQALQPLLAPDLLLWFGALQTAIDGPQDKATQVISSTIRPTARYAIRGSCS